MSTLLTAISPIWKVLLVGLVLGAGLPALYAVGVRASAGTVANDGTVTTPGPLGRVVSVICYLVIVVVVLAALVVLASSKTFLAKFGLS